MIQNIAVCLSAAIALVSLTISLMSFKQKMPKLKIGIADPEYDCFFGRTQNVEKIAGCRINIINNSPVAITVNDVKLKVGNEVLRLIDLNNEHWDEVEFYFYTQENELTTDGSAINYCTNGISIPTKISPYDTVSGYVLFHYFPSRFNGNCRATLILNSAIGLIRKKIVLREYDKDYCISDYLDFLQYCKSIENNFDNQE